MTDKTNGHAVEFAPTQRKRKPKKRAQQKPRGPRSWEPDDLDVLAGQFEYRLLDCKEHGARSFFRRYKQDGPMQCLDCYVEKRKTRYVRCKPGWRVVVETEARVFVGEVALAELEREEPKTGETQP